jgi:hypothetical protein
LGLAVVSVELLFLEDEITRMASGSEDAEEAEGARASEKEDDEAVERSKLLLLLVGALSVSEPLRATREVVVRKL